MPASQVSAQRGRARGLGLYRFLNRLAWPKSYVGRLLVLCAAAMSVPLAVSLGLVVLLSGPDGINRFSIVGATLAGDLAGIGLMLVGLKLALKPVRLSTEALDLYQRHGLLPELPGDCDDEPGRLMNAIGRTISMMESVQAELLQRAETDPLTELANRRRFLSRGAEELAESRRSGAPLSVVALDIDRFKVINDTFGHAAGDGVLRTVAALVDRALRGRDAVARIGGEEFAILMPATPVAEAVVLAERLRHWIATLSMPDLDGAGITASFGVTAAAPADRDIAAVLHRADMALYDAKRAGRDCVAYRAIEADSVERTATRRRMPAIGFTARPGSSESAWMVD